MPADSGRTSIGLPMNSPTRETAEMISAVSATRTVRTFSGAASAEREPARASERNRRFMVAFLSLGGGISVVQPRRSFTASATFWKRVASFAVGIVENARRMSPERTIVPVEYFAMRCLRTASAGTPMGFTHMK